MCVFVGEGMQALEGGRSSTKSTRLGEGQGGGRRTKYVCVCGGRHASFGRHQGQLHQSDAARGVAGGKCTLSGAGGGCYMQVQRSSRLKVSNRQKGGREVHMAWCVRGVVGDVARSCNGLVHLRYAAREGGKGSACGLVCMGVGSRRGHWDVARRFTRPGRRWVGVGQ